MTNMDLKTTESRFKEEGKMGEELGVGVGLGGGGGGGGGRESCFKLLRLPVPHFNFQVLFENKAQNKNLL